MIEGNTITCYGNDMISHIVRLSKCHNKIGRYDGFLVLYYDRYDPYDDIVVEIVLDNGTVYDGDW